MTIITPLANKTLSRIFSFLRFCAQQYAVAGAGAAAALHGPRALPAADGGGGAPETHRFTKNSLKSPKD